MILPSGAKVLWLNLTLGACAALACSSPAKERSETCGSPLATIDPVQTEVAAARPQLGVRQLDPALGGCITRISDHENVGSFEAGSPGAQVQAWSADGRRVLLQGGVVLEARSQAPPQVLPSGTPWRWSPEDPELLYRASEHGIEHHHLQRGALPTVALAGIQALLPELAAAQAPNHARQVVAALGPGGDHGLLVIELDRHAANGWLPLPRDTVNRPIVPDWIAIAPEGKSVLVGWGEPGIGRFQGVEAFDLGLRYLGKVTELATRGAIALAVDDTEWYVDYAPPDANGPARIRKLPLETSSSTAHAGSEQRLLELAGAPLVSLSCAAVPASSCVATSVVAGETEVPLHNEVFEVELASTPDAPRLQRLARHRSAPFEIAHHSERVCPMSPSAAFPEATVRHDGRAILFGSNWGQGCFVEAYVVDR